MPASSILATTPDGGSEVATFLMRAADTCFNRTAATAWDVA